MKSATSVGVSLRDVVSSALSHIGDLLPGPTTDIDISVGTHVIPELAVVGYTNPSTGQVSITLDPNDAQASVTYKQTLLTWLPVNLAHEVDHSVRVLGGPGFGDTLLDDLVSEGMSTAFDAQAYPGTHVPWADYLTPSQEAFMWAKAPPLLHSTGLYYDWFFGTADIPRWTGFTIGFHIVREYLAHHPGATAASIVHETAETILEGSGYSG